MQNRKLLLIKVLLSILMLITTISCWNRRELDKIAIVAGFGIDKAEQPGKVQMTAQIIKPGEVKSPKEGGSGSSASAVWNVNTVGDSVFDAVRNFTHQSSRKLFIPHNKIIVFGEDAAREGVQKYIDFFIRDHETRVTSWILVAKGKAKKILETESELEKIPAFSVADLVEVRKATSEASAVNLQDFVTRLMSKTTAPIATIIEVSDTGKEKIPKLSGTAVFKKDKMVDILNPTESRGLLWVLGEVKSGIIVTKCSKGSNASLEIIKAKSNITPEKRDGKIHIKVEIKGESNLGSQMCMEDFSKPSTLKALEKRQAAVIKNEVMATIKKAKKLNTDIFGFGEAVHRKHPKYWKEIEDNWDDFFPNLEVKVMVDAKIKRTGLTTKPAKSD